jgi:hypothetical protein
MICFSLKKKRKIFKPSTHRPIRFLVGLRWTTSIKEDGQEIWEFESQPIGWEANNIDSSIFWLSQIVAILFFGVLLFANVLTLNIFRVYINIFYR